MKIFLAASLLTLALCFTGCLNANVLQVYNDSPECTTTIEGNFSTPKVYKHFTSAVLFNEGSKTRYKRGEVIEIKNDTILFIEKKDGALHTPDTLAYELSDIRAIIDENGFCIYGDIKESECEDYKLRFYLDRINDTDKPVILELSSNTKFSFCIKPGYYKLKSIVSYLSSDTYNISYPVFESYIDIKKGHSNYIGDITLTGKNNINENTLTIPYFYQMDEMQGAGLGLIGAAVTKIANDGYSDEVAGYYYFNINSDNEFKQDSKFPLYMCPLKITINKTL